MTYGALVVSGVFAAAVAQGIFREPARGARPVDVIEASPAPPIEVDDAVARISPLGPAAFAVDVRVRRLGVPLPGRLTLRVAFRLNDGMRSYPLSAEFPSDAAAGEWRHVTLRPPLDTAQPSLQETSVHTPAALTVERIDGRDGTEIWANPDARELLWRAFDSRRQR